jgi:hypothetical protein
MVPSRVEQQYRAIVLPQKTVPLSFQKSSLSTLVEATTRTKAQRPGAGVTCSARFSSEVPFAQLSIPSSR